LIVEQGVVKSITDDGAWVETLRQSTCQSCKARAGCGQRMLSELGQETALVFAVYTSAKPPLLSVGQEVSIGIPREVVALGSLSLYLIPVISLLLGAALFDYVTQSDVWSAIGALIGLSASGLLLFKLAKKHRCDPKITPVILES